MDKKNYITIASFPAVNRPKYLANCKRKDKPVRLETAKVIWDDMMVEFADNSTTPECSVSVEKGISLATLTKRLERLLAFGAEAPGEWVLKYSTQLTNYGGYEHCVQSLCDQIVETDPDEMVTIGVMKIKRKSVKHGHASVKLDEAKNLLALIIRHGNAQGLLSLWKSVFWRLAPQYKACAPSAKTQDADVSLAKPETRKAIASITQPCVRVNCNRYDSYRSNTINWLSEQGYSVDIDRDKAIEMVLPLSKFKGSNLDYENNANFYCAVAFKVVPGGKPGSLYLDQDGKLVIQENNWDKFVKKAQALSEWLELDWKLSE